MSVGQKKYLKVNYDVEEVNDEKTKNFLSGRDAPVRSNWVPVGLGTGPTGYPVRLGTGPTGYPVPTG